MKRFAVIGLLLVGCSGSATQSSSIPSSTVPVTTSPATTSPETTTPATTSPETTTPPGSADCPEVVAVELRQTAVGVFTVTTTVRSVDVEGVSFADAWEVRDLAGSVLGTRILTHPHANEQPFTRSLSDVPIPPEVSLVEVDARDSARGFCGASLTVEVPHS